MATRKKIAERWEVRTDDVVVITYQLRKLFPSVRHEREFWTRRGKKNVRVVHVTTYRVTK